MPPRVERSYLRRVAKYASKDDEEGAASPDWLACSAPADSFSMDNPLIFPLSRLSQSLSLPLSVPRYSYLEFLIDLASLLFKSLRLLMFMIICCVDMDLSKDKSQERDFEERESRDIGHRRPLFKKEKKE